MKTTHLLFCFTAVVSTSAMAQWSPSTASTNDLIYRSGNVGIGTSSPNSKLHVHEDEALGTSSADDYRILSTVSGKTGTNIFKRHLWLKRDDTFSISWNTARLHDGIAIDQSYAAPGIDTRTWWERDPANNIQSWGHGGATLMTLSAGKLGIGTAIPSVHLDVVGNAKIAPSGSGQSPDNVAGLFVENDGSSNGWYVFQTATAGGGKSFSITNGGLVGIGTSTPSQKLEVYNGRMRVNSSAPIVELYEHDTDKLWFIVSDGRRLSIRHNTTSSANEIFTIKEDGNVGIGTTNPGSFRLAVEGKVGASEVVVTLARPWPDYVFEPNYNLPSLSELEQYIKTNKHLPEVPTANEVKENGLSLGEMNAILLKKVEELTLHLIEQNNRIKTLESQLK